MANSNRLHNPVIPLAAGQAITLNLGKPGQHTVIVLVSRGSDHSLQFSTVAFNGSTKNSSGSSSGGSQANQLAAYQQDYRAISHQDKTMEV